MRLFIAHASEDNKEIAKPLANALKAEGFDVWYDEYRLRIGDSLRREIDKALQECHWGVVILSKSFFEKHWPQMELDALVARETKDRRKIILPVWHDIDHDYISCFSPTLADRMAVSTSAGMANVVRSIKQAVVVESVVSNTSAFTSFPTTKTYDTKQASNAPSTTVSHQGDGLKGRSTRFLPEAARPGNLVDLSDVLDSCPACGADEVDSFVGCETDCGNFADHRCTECGWSAHWPENTDGL